MTSGNQTVDTMGMINISGNVTPQIWYSTITRPNGKPYLLAITLLSDIVYWYRPVEERDEQSGKVIGWKKRFSGQMLQKTYQQYADLYGESKRSIKAALDRLEELGVIRKEFRDVKYENGMEAYNLMFIALNADVLYRLTYPEAQNTSDTARTDGDVIDGKKAEAPRDKEKTELNTYPEEYDGEAPEADETFMESDTIPPTKFCTTPYKITHHPLQNNVPPPTKFCTTPLQNNVPPPTKFCKGTKNTTENTNIDNQSINQGNNNILILNGTDEMDGMENYAQIVKKNIEYETLIHDRPNQRIMIDEIVELMVEAISVKRQTVRINGADYPHQLVKKKLLWLKYQHICYVLECLGKNTSKVANIRAYLLTVLFNASSTIDNYYQAEVNHDMYG